MAERVLIVGATSAIAAEVAKIFASRAARLHLVARDGQKLEAVMRSLAGAPGALDAPHATVTSALADFDDLGQVGELVQEAARQLGGFDVVLIAHGELGDQAATEQSFDAAEAIFRTNLLSVVAFLVPLANLLEAQRGGSLGVITSVAGDRGRPRNYTYGAAKGALNIYLQGLRSRLFKAGVRVVTLKLGPVDTPMTVSHAKNALFAQPATVASSIVRALHAGSPEAYVPSFWGAIMPVVKNTPERLFQLFPFLSGR
jgi:decaprenylphospho-beta-D-erythro-pentofuranosid-2-ulose 2-reductase